MSSLLGFLGSIGDSINDDGSQSYLTRLNNAADPVAASQRQLAPLQVQQQQMQNQIQQSALATLANAKNNGITNPAQILTSLATVSPEYTEKAAALAAQNPLVSFATPSGNSPAAQTNSGNSPANNPPATPAVQAPPGDNRNYQYLSTLPEQYQPLVKAISEGGGFPPQVSRGSQTGLQLLAAASQFDPSFDPANYEDRKNTVQDYSSKGKSGQAITSANIATKHLAQLAVNGIDLNNRSFTPWNTVANDASALMGNDPTTNFESTANLVAPEVAKVARGGGSVAEGDVNEARKVFSSSGSPQQILGNIANTVDLLQSKTGELQNTYNQNMGNSSHGKQFLTPDSQQTLQDLKDLHGFANEDKLDSPQAQQIIGRLRIVAGQQPSSQTTTTQNTTNSQQSPSNSAGVTPDQALAELKRRGKVK